MKKFVFIDNSLPKQLRSLRLAKGLTQRQVAASLSVSRSSYTYYENGKVQPDIETLIALAKYYGVTIDYLTIRR